MAEIITIKPEYQGPRLNLILQPEEEHLSIPLAKTVRQLLEALKLPEETALIIRDGQLLTPDRHLYPGNEVIVRKVGSRG